MCFSILDLFVVGLAFDIVGAALLARGLLVSPRLITVLAGQYWDVSPPDAVDRCRNRVDAEFGVSSLIVGFTLQAVGYGLQLAGVGSGSSTSRVVTAFALGGFAAAGIALFWWRTRTRRLVRLLIRVAKEREGKGGLGDEKTSEWTRKKVNLLADLGRAAGFPTVPSDYWGNIGGKSKYVERVFRVDVPLYAQDEEREAPPESMES